MSTAPEIYLYELHNPHCPSEKLKPKNPGLATHIGWIPVIFVSPQVWSQTWSTHYSKHARLPAIWTR